LKSEQLGTPRGCARSWERFTVFLLPGNLSGAIVSQLIVPRTSL
jgi:hypothetical protein